MIGGKSNNLQASTSPSPLLSPSAGQLVREDPVFRQDDRYFHSNEEAFDRAMEKSVRYIKRARELDLDRLDRQLFKL